MQKSKKKKWCTLLKIKNLLLHITCKRVEIFQKFHWFWVCLILNFKQSKFENNWLENNVAHLKKPKNLKFPYLGSGWRYWFEILDLVLYPHDAPLCKLSSKNSTKKISRHCLLLWAGYMCSHHPGLSVSPKQCFQNFLFNNKPLCYMLVHVSAL